MSIYKLERVMWRLRSKNKGMDVVPYVALRRAIIMEIGTDMRTYHRCKEVLLLLGWIKTKKGGNSIILTGKDVTGDY